MEIIEAEEQHISAMQQIYAWHVVNGSASFETAAPDREEMLARLNKTRSAGLPWLHRAPSTQWKASRMT